jgi:hypothetical protein
MRGSGCEAGAVLFPKRFWAGIADGSITVTFRRWKRPQVVVGNRYRTPGGIVEVESFDAIDPRQITDADARRAGHDDARAVLAELPAGAGIPVYRIAFHRVDEPDPRAVLAGTDELRSEDVAAIDRRLDRLDRSSTSGPWTTAVLTLIAEHPQRRAGDLAAIAGREKEPFKLDVRKLKNLGLTLSLPVGYELSPRGRAYLARTTRKEVTRERYEPPGAGAG